MLIQNGSSIHIGRLGRLVDDYCLPQHPLNEVRKLWKQIDRSGYGCVGREALEDSRWAALFDRADANRKGYIGYWEFYGVRKSWEFITFNVWYKQEQATAQTFDSVF